MTGKGRLDGGPWMCLRVLGSKSENGRNFASSRRLWLPLFVVVLYDTMLAINRWVVNPIQSKSLLDVHLHCTDGMASQVQRCPWSFKCACWATDSTSRVAPGNYRQRDRLLRQEHLLHAAVRCVRQQLVHDHRRRWLRGRRLLCVRHRWLRRRLRAWPGRPLQLDPLG